MDVSISDIYRIFYRGTGSSERRNIERRTRNQTWEKVLANKRNFEREFFIRIVRTRNWKSTGKNRIEKSRNRVQMSGRKQF